ncbi:hypothetical protein ACFWYW_46790 [Nonomuraea sp. NPDC059023]|uniref:hypothetical protein n=1 Tax=unclassified Nonomuraea TaxID=2593643 RepID=UPI00369D5D05
MTDRDDVHSHPVMKLVHERREEARRLYLSDQGAAVEQTLTLEQAYDLARHIETVRTRLLGEGRVLDVDDPRLPPELPPVEPGILLGTLYGVRLWVEDPAPLVAVQHGGEGHIGISAIAGAAVPEGCVPHAETRLLMPYSLDEDTPMLKAWARREIGKRLGEPFVLVVVGRKDLTPADEPPDTVWMAPEWKLGYGFTFRAQPGSTAHIVLRPAPTLPPGLLPPSQDGVWGPRPPHLDPHEQIAVPVVPHATSFDDLEGAIALLYARPTGRVEVNRDLEIAEVYEVTQ